MNRSTASAVATLVALFSLVAVSPAAGLSMGAIDSADFDSITGAEIASLTLEYDFLPLIAGGDGLVTSTVFQGTGAAAGNYVYTYTVSLYGAPPASVGSVVGMTFEFHTMPEFVAGIGDAFYVTDDAGTVSPDMAFYQTSTQTVGFRFIPQIHNDDLSHQFGLFSPNLPAETTAQMIDSGALGGLTTVLSNGVPSNPVPEPSAPLVFALGLLTVAYRCRTRQRA